jgi:hypothetical protein
MKRYRFSLQVGALVALIVALVLGSATDVLAQRQVLPSQNAVRPQVSDVDAETLIIENLGSGVAADVFRLSCTAECIRADVNDTGPFNDTRFKVTVTGSSSNFVGVASAISPAGGLSLSAEVCSGSNVNASRRAYVIITEVNAPGAENYDSLMLCRLSNANNIFPTFVNPLITTILDQ